jgi:hypothetical protein
MLDGFWFVSFSSQRAGFFSLSLFSQMLTLSSRGRVLAEGSAFAFNAAPGFSRGIPSRCHSERSEESAFAFNVAPGFSPASLTPEIRLSHQH